MCDECAASLKSFKNSHEKIIISHEFYPKLPREFSKLPRKFFVRQRGTLNSMYKLLISSNIQDFNLQEALGEISASRREKALKFKHEQGQRECVLAYLLLKRALKEVYGMDGNPEMVEQEGGKPLLKDHPEIHFNLSHCKSAVACAIGDEPVGVDVERVRKYDDSLARHVLNGKELEEVEASDDKARAFIRLWTKKEALLKLTGEGIRSNLKTVLEQEDIEFETTHNAEYVCTVATFKQFEKE